MKIVCTVETVNRALPSLNVAGKKAARSSLVIGTSDKDLILLHQTNDNIQGKLYKVKNNIENVFLKFANEGKATIRFKEPKHDLAIKCDPVQLKGFLKTLKLGLEGSTSNQLSKIDKTRLEQQKPLKPIKTKLKILSKGEYPYTQGFPRTLQNLTINNANQILLDSRVLRLRNLITLNIEDNSLITLPEQLGASLPNLSELHLKNNRLGQSCDWKWIVNNRLQHQLKLLDVRMNGITFLPDKIVELQHLVTLKVDSNRLQGLPDGIGSITSLRFLSASNNRISYLPSSIFLLKLDSIDVSENNFLGIHSKKLEYNDFHAVPSLVDTAASNLLTNRTKYSERDLPRTLIEHLQGASFCPCGKPCFSKQPQSYVGYLNSKNRAHTVVTTYNSDFAVAVRFCSLQCYTKEKGAT